MKQALTVDDSLWIVMNVCSIEMCKRERSPKRRAEDWFE